MKQQALRAVPRPSRRVSESCAEVRLGLAEYLLSAEEPSECVARVLEWLGKHTGLDQVTVLEVDHDAGRLAATAGYGKTVTVLRRSGDAWTPLVVLADRDRFHHLAAGNVDSDPEPELVACGFSGRVFVIERKAP